ncbi:tyrosine-type recombinase/integrase [Sphingomonas hylomeconis]|uniref:Tyrosine-type recombinase/integrase n=1 Tax=Sphingomonas hylomeconis TaxID=1395958 RepID=A0ABV7STR4_9SPHN|nr:integrase arm-type DNA-binding domain-containing protein [Sphingomonas hylomeconis]
MLTATACKNAKPAERPYKLSDAHGLFLYVTAKGFKGWRLKYRFGGKEKLLTFGTFPEVSLIEARELRDAALRQLRGGTDPAIDKKQRAAARVTQADLTFKAIADDWIASQEPTWSPRYARLVLYRFTHDVYPKLGSLPIDTITTPQVLAVLRVIESRGAIETAHRVRQRISEVFARAIASGVATSDPAAIAARALSPVKRGRFPAVVSVEAARAILRKVEQQPGYPLTKLASRLLALTAVRSGVVRWAEASEFEDLDGASPIWRIPAAKMKLLKERKEDAAFEFIVTLSRQAVETVKVAIEFSRGAPLIFRSIRHPRKPISDNTIGKAYRDAGFSGVHVPHGWRTTYSTIMNELAQVENRVGDRAIIDLTLAHIPAGVEAAYNRSGYMPRRRELAQEWADMLVQDLVPPAELLKGPRHS